MTSQPLNASQQNAPVDFETVQTLFSDIAGEEGIAQRQKHYARFFLRFGKGVRIEAGCRFIHPERIVLDDDARINTGALIYGSGGVWIGRHARIGPRCFIHSANHDVSASAKAYFERGYIDAAVQIGELCLVSANVSILPGAEIGAGSFIACGAVITKGIYPEGSRLQGVPARAHQDTAVSNPPEAPDIVIFTPADNQWSNLARHILIPLGLPQIAVVDETNIIPESAHSILLFGPTDWHPVIQSRQKIWKLVPGNTPVNVPGLPTHRPFTVVKSANSPSSSDGIFVRSAFWILNRLRKRTSPLTAREFREWLTTLDVLQRVLSDESSLPKTVLDHLIRIKPAGMKKWLSRKPDEPIQDWYLRLANSGEESEVSFFERWRRKIRPASPNYIEVMADPERLVREVLEGRVSRELVTQYIKRMWPNGATGLRLATFALASLLADDNDSAVELIKAIRSDNWLLPESLLFRSSHNRDTPSLSPLTLAFWAVAGSKGLAAEITPECFELITDCGQNFCWNGFESGQLIDHERRLVSAALAENWKQLHMAPCPDGMQFLLENHTYPITTLGLEQQWFEVFRAIQGDRPLLKLRPWPAGYDAAISVRFDVDRPVAAQRISELVELQASLANAPCAAWYYFQADPARVKQEHLLRRHWQETGIHAESFDDAVQDSGVTHHSSLKSVYWQGDRTSHNLASRNCKYGEFLATRLPSPRPALLKDTNDTCSQLWLMPLHFPLEGSTEDLNLSYFDERRAYFLETLSAGGLAIITSHPDIKPDLLKNLLQQVCHSDRYWFATPARALERFQSVMMPGEVIALRKGDNYRLLSKRHIADLAVEIWRPGQASAESVNIQLIQGRPRHVTDTEEVPTGKQQ